MEVLHPRCCGIDVHKEIVVVCLRVQEDRRVHKEVQSFGTTTADLCRLPAWLRVPGARTSRWSRRASIGSPVFNLLEATVSVRAGQCAAHQGGAGPEDRRARLRVARGSVGAWADSGEFHSACWHSRLPGSYATSEEPDSRSDDAR